MVGFSFLSSCFEPLWGSAQMEGGLSHSCRGTADRKVPNNIIGNSELGFAWVCSGMLGVLWLATDFWRFVGFACGLLGDCSGLFGLL